MLKYTCTKYEQEGRTFHFVTKRAAFNPEQMAAIASDIARKELEAAKGERVKRFKLPQRNIFLSDLKQGAKHCIAKYNVSLEDIIYEGEQEFPGSTVKNWLVK